MLAFRADKGLDSLYDAELRQSSDIMQVSITTPFSDSIYAPTTHHLEIDGRRVSGIRVSGTAAGYVVSATSAEAGRVLRTLPIALFPPTVSYVDVPLAFEWRDFAATAATVIDNTIVAILFKFTPDLMAWTGSIEFERVMEAVAEVVPNIFSPAYALAIDRQTGVFSIRLKPAGETLDSSIEAWTTSLSTLRDEVESRLEALEGLTLSFQFPPEVKVACQQYLLYFAEFLSDLGVAAQTSLRENAGQILFSVTPTDGRHALSAISDALAVFLALPNTPLDHSSDEAIETLKLSANIHHLKAQLDLAKALLQTQAATIDAQKFALDVHQRLVTPSVIRPANSDREELFGGAVALTRFEGKGFEISVAEIFRRLRRRFWP